VNKPVSTKPKDKPITILGAGCAGLAAGLRLTKRGYPVVLIEKEDHVGGLSGGVRINGNNYEYGPHTFHATDPEILNDIKLLMGNDLIEYYRTIKIKFLGNYFRFPLVMSDVLFKLPILTVLRAGLSFVWHFVAGAIRRPSVETSETVLKRYYGSVLYEIFFKSYITSVWGISPAEFSPAFARQRIPRMNFLGVLDKAGSVFKRHLRRNLKIDNYVEKMEGNLYTTKQGFSLITERMADSIIEHGGKVILNAEVNKLFREENKVYAVEYIQDGQPRQIECSGVINTLPINETVTMLEPVLDADVINSAQELKFRALVFVGLLVRRAKVLPSSFMYFRELSFNRISDLAQFGFHIKPDGCTQLVAEISCGIGDREWTDDEYAREAVLADLVDEHLLDREDVIETHVFRAKHAYPIYTLHYEKHLDTLMKAVDEMANLETAGRQGRFQYINSHIALKMGYEAVDRLTAGLEMRQ
jgi:protoporphyrinogen oxidase